ncbi:MAG: HAMP domain-containing sensor histidine kinase [Leeuwenhoekiella sp.]
MVAVINLLQIKAHSPHRTPLLRKASKTFLTTAVILMAVSTIILFFYTQELLRKQIEEELYSNKDRVEKLLQNDQTIKGIPPIMEVEKVRYPETLKFNVTLIYDPLQDEIELFEQLTETTQINGQHYRITVRAMVIESEDILFAIVLTFISIILMTFLFQFYVNRSRNEKLWRPFFLNLSILKEFSLKAKQPLTFQDSEILEFHELNMELESLTKKVQIDYQNLKQFTEDVSHEMHTPLAIMQAKIDTVINDQEINEAQFETFSSLQEDIQRLKQLNKKLILLAKIENDQFTNTETFLVAAVLKNCISNFTELFDVPIHLIENEEATVQMDRSLAAVLFNNLLSNAIKHAAETREVQVILDKKSVKISNKGKRILENPNTIFERYYKESKRKDSTGLGLSIVKKICDYYGFVPSYRFDGNQHIFQINFQNQLVE